jgi:hypothetical protein
LQKFRLKPGSRRTLPASLEVYFIMSSSTDNLPTIVTDDGFADVDSNDRLIQGTVARCVDGHWSKDKAPFPPDTRLIVLGTCEALQLWRNNKVIKTIKKEPGRPLPDIDELNAQIPESDWEIGLDKKPRKPWVHQYVAYMLDPKDASLFTYINNTFGALKAVTILKDKVKWMRALRGSRVVPVIKLDSKPMPTAHGMKQRPEFTVVEWRDLGGGGDGDLPPPPTKPVPAIEHVGKPVKPVSTAEVLNDEIGI